MGIATAKSIHQKAPFAASNLRAKRPITARERRRMLTFYSFIAPWLIGFVLLDLIPLLVAFGVSLTTYDGLSLGKFVGFQNYVRAILDDDVLFSLKRGLLWAVFNVPVYLAVCFALSMVLNQDVRGRGIFRTIFYLPYVIPAVVAVWVFKIFLDTNVGLMNAILSMIRPGTAIKWLTTYALPSLSMVALWSGLGFGIVVFLAGLQNIPSELQEAARMDGANGLQVLRHVTLPLMTPVIFFMLVLSMISAMQELTRPLLFSSVTGQTNVPPRAIYLFTMHVYRQLFVHQRYGYGSALLWLLILAIFVLAVVVFRTQRYWVHYEVTLEDEKK